MQYLITFLEGLISFVSPCMLPMLPVYLSYFAGGTEKKRTAFLRALAFVLGFTTLFCLMGLFAHVHHLGAALLVKMCEIHMLAPVLFFVGLL